MDQSPNQQILVSGIGAVSAAGNNVSANFANMTSGIRNIKPAPTLFKCDFNNPVFECDSAVLDKEYIRHQRTLALALKAVEEAIRDAGLSQGVLKKSKVGVCLGTTVACTLNNLKFYSDIRSDKPCQIQPLKRYIEGDISEVISTKYKLSGPVISIANACASGTNAIATAFSWIKSGRCDIAIAGGADELNLIPYCGFKSLQVMSDKPSLPFDIKRKGLNLGEGSGILILESEKSAKKRSHKPNIVLAGFGGASDAYHLTGPHPEGVGLFSSIEQAIKMSGIESDDIDYINAHGTGTIDNDKTEAYVFSKLSQKKNIPFSSTKYYTGHTLGAAGGIEAAICVKGMREGHFPGQPGIENDPKLPVKATNKNISYNGKAVLSTSMAFGGSCASLLFKPYEKKRTSCKIPLRTGLKISATGIIGPFGRGLKQFESALNDKPSKRPSFKTIPEEVLKDIELKKIRRRADKLSIAMLCAAKDAISILDLSEQELKNTAVINVTSLGPHNTTFKFLDGLLDFGHSAPSPTHFSNSVHNAPSFYITSFLKIRGLSLTITGFKKPFVKALEYSKTLLETSDFQKVLIVAGDELGEPMLKMAGMWYDYQEKPNPIWGEGAVAFLLEKTEDPGSDISYSNKIGIEELFGKTLVNDAFELAGQVINIGKSKKEKLK